MVRGGLKSGVMDLTSDFDCGIMLTVRWLADFFVNQNHVVDDLNYYEYLFKCDHSS